MSEPDIVGLGVAIMDVVLRLEHMPRWEDPGTVSGFRTRRWKAGWHGLCRARDAGLGRHDGQFRGAGRPLSSGQDEWAGFAGAVAGRTRRS